MGQTPGSQERVLLSFDLKSNEKLTKFYQVGDIIILFLRRPPLAYKGRLIR